MRPIPARFERLLSTVVMLACGIYALFFLVGSGAIYDIMAGNTNVGNMMFLGIAIVGIGGAAILVLQRKKYDKVYTENYPKFTSTYMPWICIVSGIVMIILANTDMFHELGLDTTGNLGGLGIIVLGILLIIFRDKYEKYVRYVSRS